MNKYLLLLSVFLLSFQYGYSQKYTLTGKVIDQDTRETLIGALIEMINLDDTTKVHHAITNTEGLFSIDKLEKTNYKLSVSFIGYEKYSQDIQILFKDQSVGTILLISKSETIGEVTVVAEAPQAIIKGDTTEFVANAFKVTPDANIEDMVKKMPGVTVENGSVKAQGEDIKKVLVDGKTFFGEDPSIALKNLPAEIVDKVQIFDEQSEQSQFTGFNDGQTTKTMNIVTRNNRRNGSFGKITAAYGDQDRYLAGLNLNNFRNDRRISLLASSNNVNQQNFGTQNLLGVRRGGMSGHGSRGGPMRNSFGGFGTQSGLSTINSVGLNFSDSYNNKLKLSGSYFFNNNNDDIYQRSSTEYILSSDSSSMESSNTISETKNYNNRFNLRVEWDIDSMNSIRIIPSLNFQSNTSESNDSESQAFFIEESNFPQYTSESSDNRKTTGYNLSNRTTYRHKFKKNGRTFSIDQDTRINQNDPYSTSLSNVEYLTTLNNKTTDRITTTNTDGYSLTTNLAYTEPVGKISIVQINARNSFSKTYSFRKASDLDSLLNSYLQIDTLSNKYLNFYITNSLGLSYLIRTDKLMANAGVEVQNSNLSGKQTYPHETETAKHFYNVLPNFHLRYRVAQQRTLIISYRTSTNPPSISQLQDVAEYSSNQTKLTIGNPDLEPEYRHNIFSRLIYVNRETGSNFFFLLGSTISQNSIGNSTIYYDTIQVTKPVNKGTGYTLRSMANLGFRVKPIKSNMNLSTGYSFNNTPGFVNGKGNIATSHTLTQSFVLSSNISEKIDFTLSTNINYSIVKNSVASGNDDNYYSQNSGFRLNCILWKGITLQNDISNMFYKGLSTGYNLNSTVINVGLGKKVFKHQTGEFRLTVYDLLNNNSSITRTITANQITDREITSLNRYIMASFTYTFRKFGQGDMPKFEHRPGDFNGPPFRHDGGFPHR
jgi:hypothetical protein